MSNFAECTLVKLVPSEPYFVALTTFDIYHGRSTRFLLQKKDLENLVNDPDASRILDTDIGSYFLDKIFHLHYNRIARRRAMMAKQAVYQVRMDEEIKNRVEALYRELGTTFAEAVRIFAVQSLREQGMPFTPSEMRGKSFGSLSSFANPELIPEESIAFEKAMVAKHADN